MLPLYLKFLKCLNYDHYFSLNLGFMAGYYSDLGCHLIEYFALGFTVADKADLILSQINSMHKYSNFSNYYYYFMENSLNSCIENYRNRKLEFK